MSDDNSPTADELTARMDAQVAANREFGHRSGGNTVEPGQYEAPSVDALQIAENAETAADVPTAGHDVAPAPGPTSNDDNAANVTAMDAQVAAANGGATTGMTTGVQTSAPAKSEKTKAPARAKTTK